MSFIQIDSDDLELDTLPPLFSDNSFPTHPTSSFVSTISFNSIPSTTYTKKKSLGVAPNRSLRTLKKKSEREESSFLPSSCFVDTSISHPSLDGVSSTTREKGRKLSKSSSKKRSLVIVSSDEELNTTSISSNSISSFITLSSKLSTLSSSGHSLTLPSLPSSCSTKASKKSKVSLFDHFSSPTTLHPSSTLATTTTTTAAAKPNTNTNANTDPNFSIQENAYPAGFIPISRLPIKHELLHQFNSSSSKTQLSSLKTTASKSFTNKKSSFKKKVGRSSRFKKRK